MPNPEQAIKNIEERLSEKYNENRCPWCFIARYREVPLSSAVLAPGGVQ